MSRGRGQTPPAAASHAHPFGIREGPTEWNFDLFDQHSQGLALAMGFAPGSRNEAGLMVWLAKGARQYVAYIASGQRPLPDDAFPEDDKCQEVKKEPTEEEREIVMIPEESEEEESEEVTAGETGGTPTRGAGGGQTPTIDEEVAKVGLSVKLHFDQTPDLIACAQAMEDAFARSDPHAPVADVARDLAKVFVVLRAIRGAAGIIWAAEKLNQESATELLGVEDVAEALRGTAAWLLEACSQDQCSSSSMCHREGRHTMFSGPRALAAIVKFSHSAAAVVGILSMVIEEMLVASRQEDVRPLEIDSSYVLLAFVACEGRLPLAVTPQGVGCFAGRYNAVNAGWTLLGWGWRSGRITLPEIDVVLLHTITQAQSEKSRAHMADLGLNVPGALEKKAALLETISVPMLPTRSGPLASFPPPGIFLGNVVVHVCEIAQLRAAVDDDDAIHRVCQAGVARVRRVAAPVMQSLVAADERLDGKGRQKCITVDIFDAVQASVWRCPVRRLRAKSALAPLGSDTAPAMADIPQARSGPPKRKAPAERDAGPPKRKASVKGGARSGPPKRKAVTQAMSPPKRKARPGRIRRTTAKGVLDGRFVPRTKGRLKDRVSCPACGIGVRRDNLARHVNSARCRPALKHRQTAFCSSALSCSTQQLRFGACASCRAQPW